eukprot:NODE_137_length_18042_cov_0.768823.p4 type:complete len:314 gc:universal NODE_137_length_18042_cov_0.768823:2457-1516(-)
MAGPPPPGPPPPPVASASIPPMTGDKKDLLKAIQKGNNVKLRKVETVDKSAPIIEAPKSSNNIQSSLGSSKPSAIGMAPPTNMADELAARLAMKSNATGSAPKFAANPTPSAALQAPKPVLPSMSSAPPSLRPTPPRPMRPPNLSAPHISAPEPNRPTTTAARPPLPVSSPPMIPNQRPPSARPPSLPLTSGVSIVGKPPPLVPFKSPHHSEEVLNRKKSLTPPSSSENLMPSKSSESLETKNKRKPPPPPPKRNAPPPVPRKKSNASLPLEDPMAISDFSFQPPPNMPFQFERLSKIEKMTGYDTLKRLAYL